MRCVDVNVLVYAHRTDVPEHEPIRAWLDHARVGAEPLAIPHRVANGFVRVVTHPKVFQQPTPLADAMAFVDGLMGSPATLTIGPGERHWGLVRRLASTVGATGNHVADAALAAIAIEHGAAWVSCDRGFARFPDLRWIHPLDEHGAPPGPARRQR